MEQKSTNHDHLREDFESWIQTTQGWKTCKLRGKPMSLRIHMNGHYADFRVNDRWLSWIGASKKFIDELAALRKENEGLRDCFRDAELTKQHEDGPLPKPELLIALRDEIDDLHNAEPIISDAYGIDKWMDVLEEAARQLRDAARAAMGDSHE